jgi:chromosome partitioning protein
MNAIILAAVSQKGGVGKSTVARLLSTVYAGAGWDVKLADLNLKQKTAVNWVADRLHEGITPEITAEPFGTVKKALRLAAQYDAMIFDGAPDSHATTLEIAKAAHAVFIPTGVTKDDLMPQVLLAHELTGDHGIAVERILFVLNKTLDSQVSVDEARTYVERAGYACSSNHLKMSTGYQRAQNIGRSVAETEYPTLNQAADRLAQEMVDFIELRVGLKKETA